MTNLRNSPLESALVEAVKKRLSQSGLSRRAIERELRLGHGTVSNILRGQKGLRVQHLEILGSVLGFTLEQILREARGRPDVPHGPVPDEALARRIASHVVDELLRRPLVILEKL